MAARLPGSSRAVTTVDVAQYYDQNTRRFLFMGKGRPSVHRELWAPGVDSVERAMAHVDHLVADTVAGFALGVGPSILDFGCGVGGTLFHLAERFPEARLTGVTLSAMQLQVADRFARAGGLASRCSFVLGDFHEATLGTNADVAIAIESFAHSTSPSALLANVTRHLRPGGRLVVIDDFLSADESSLDSRQRARVVELRAGWRVPALGTVQSLVDEASAQGLALAECQDLTALIRPGSRLRDRLLGLFSPLLARLGLVRLPLYGNMIGGNALQVGLREGFLRYRLLVFRKGGQ